MTLAIRPCCCYTADPRMRPRGTGLPSGSRIAIASLRSISGVTDCRAGTQTDCWSPTSCASSTPSPSIASRSGPLDVSRHRLGVRRAASRRPGSAGGQQVARRAIPSPLCSARTSPRAARSEHRKTCVVDAVSGAPIKSLPRPSYARLFPKRLVRGLFQQRRRTGIEPAWELSPPHRF